MRVDIQFHTEKLEEAKRKLVEAESALETSLALAEVQRREEMLMNADR